MKFFFYFSTWFIFFTIVSGGISHGLLGPVFGKRELAGDLFNKRMQVLVLTLMNMALLTPRTKLV